MEDVVDRPLTAVETDDVGEMKSDEKKLSRGSSLDSNEMYSSDSPKEILKSSGKAIPPIGEPNIIFIPHVIDKTLILDRNNDDNTFTPSSNVSVVDISGGGADVGYRKPTRDEQELYLQTLYKLPNSHNFYCPNCNSCITKVIILRDGGPSSPSPSPPPLSDFNGGASLPPLSYPPLEQPPSSYVPTEQRPRSSTGPDVGEIVVDDRGTTNSDEESGRILCSNCFSFLVPIGTWISSQLGFGRKKSPIPAAEIGGTGTSGTGTTNDTGSSSIYEPEIEGGGSIIVTIPPVGDETAGRKVRGGRSLEIVKSIVYGGLTEAITSMGIVTSAASAGTPTENIVALALANLITGLIVITNNLCGLKSNQHKKKEQNEAQLVDPYEQALGDRHHYLLHFTTAILSFLLFGLLPPLVYGFSFRDADDTDLKLAAVAASSLLCIALLAIAKAYVEKPRKWQEFAKTLIYYLSIGFGASGLSYLAGKDFDMLIENFGWFKRDPMLPPTLLLPNMDFAKSTWGSI